MLVINKPSGLLSQPGLDLSEPSVDRLVQKYCDGFLVHRLDKDTSGLMVCGKTHEMAKFLSDNLSHSGAIKKTYHAIVAGKKTLPTVGRVAMQSRDPEKFVFSKNQDWPNSDTYDMLSQFKVLEDWQFDAST